MSDKAANERMLDALSGIREGLQADHADLEVIGLEASTARVRLLIGPETCQECIMPKDFLEQIMLMSLQDNSLPVSRVELEDPRAE